MGQAIYLEHRVRVGGRSSDVNKQMFVVLQQIKKKNNNNNK